MNQISKSNAPYKIPWWAQLAAGLVLLALVYMIAISSTSYLSAWEEEDSNFFESATQALKIAGINPTAPTAFFFWENECEPCKPALKALHDAPVRLRVHGIHLKENSGDEVKLRRMWLEHSPRASSLTIDKDEILQISFKVKAVPYIFLYLPKQKKIYSYLGDPSRSKSRMNEIIDSEY